MNFRLANRKIRFNLNQIIALVFLCIIITGAIFLSLPIAAKVNASRSFLTALFTAASSVCVTGLSVVDLWSSYTYFGQAVILLLMEIGGLGFMSVVSVLIYLSKHNADIPSLSLMAGTLGSDTLKNITRIQRRLILGSLAFEAIGAVILFINFIPALGWTKALWFGIFHAVSAFCNGGFDLMGIMKSGSSLESFQNDPAVLLTVSFLIIIGGIGFAVWDDIASSRHIRDWSIYTRLAVTTTLVLVVSGSVLFLLFEFHNSSTIGNMPLAGKILNAFFQSATTRTAGFAAIAQNGLTDSSTALTVILMMIGGSAGSTAGGIKTVTFAILVCTAWSAMRGRKSAVLFKRHITAEQSIQAYTVMIGFILLAVIGSFILCAPSDISFVQSFFESVSALATVGLSLGITGSLSCTSRIILILFMYIGRVGLLTLTIGFLRSKDPAALRYPSVKLLIG